MSRHPIAALAGVVLVLGLAAPAARAQRCPYQMQMWYQVQMQQWASQRQAMQTQRSQPAPNYRANEVQTRTPRPVERPPSWQVRPDYGVLRTTHSSAVVRRTVEPGREVLHRETFSVTHPELHLHLSGQLHRTLPERPPERHTFTVVRRTVEPGREALHHERLSVTHSALHLRLSGQLHRAVPERPPVERRTLPVRRAMEPVREVRRPETIREGGAKPVVKWGARFSCAGGCHTQSDRVSQPLRQPQLTGNMPVVRSQPLLGLLPPRRVGPPSNPFLVTLLEQPRLPPAAPPPWLPKLGQVVPTDGPPWLLALEQPPPASPLRQQHRPPAERSRPAETGPTPWSTEPAGLETSSQGRVSPGLSDLLRTLMTPPPAPVDGMPAEPSLYVATAEVETAAQREAPPSLEALLESPPPPPTLDALRPPPAEVRVAEGGVRVASAAPDLGSLLEAPPPKRDAH
jgi:hypothetical protein